MIKILYYRWFVNNSRTSIVLRNTFLSVLLKGFSIAVSFIMVPLTLKAVTHKEYGIILTITSIISWISFFDVGIGNGLRNKLGKCLAEGDFALARRYVSTAYFYILLIFIVVFLVYALVHPFINWYAVLNINETDVVNLSSCILLVILLFVLRFILQLICVILLADQQSYLNDAALPLSNFLTLILIYIFYSLHTANFFNLILSICGAPVVIFLLYTVILFAGKYSWLLPSKKYIDHSLRKDLLGLGFKFFLVQIIAIIIFSTTNFLIANLYKMEDVAVFNIASRYYGIAPMIFSIVLTPLWGAFTNAWYQGDRSWILETIRKMVFLNFGLLTLSLLMFIYYRPLSELWLNETILIDPLFALTFVLFNFQLSFNNVYSYFLNSIGKINLQLYSSVAGGVINIPFTIIIAKTTDLGIASICIANILCLLPASILTTIQVHKVLHNKAKGVWLS
jgi:O-antigen/teichoic acid export membrane protein